MDKKAFTEIEERLLEVNKVIGKGDDGDAGSSSASDLETLVTSYGSDEKPSENARLLTAWWFSQYGSAPFSVKWIKETGDATGLTLPATPAMTFRSAKVKGKDLYNPVGKGGLFKVTVVGETFLKATYKVKKGTKPSPAETK